MSSSEGTDNDTGAGTPAAGDGVEALIALRGITRVRHFTTNRGALGVIATGELRSRQLLAADEYLEHIYFPNCSTRRDVQWTGHVSLSVTDINASFFAICSGKPSWHANMDGFWVIVDLDPAILTHPDVVFTTTNNMYSGVERGAGVAGLEAMFADPIRPYRPASTSPVIHRTAATSAAQPTDPQAEVLYPDRIPAEYITQFIVREAVHTNDLRAQQHVFRHLFPSVPVAVDPSAFDQRPMGEMRSPLIEP